MNLYLQDNCFYGDLGCSKHASPLTIKWNRLPPIENQESNVVFFTDYCLNQVNHPTWKELKKIAWLIEPYVINPHSYEYIKQNYNLFDLILTHHSEYLNTSANFRYYPSAMTWINREDWTTYIKDKNISIFASNKNFAPGHQLRHQIINILKQKNIIDVYGTGYNPVKYKLDGLKNYRFSISIENCRVDHYFTEKLIDCFATYTIPIYWGCPEINKFFNPEGMYICNNTGELLKIINECSNNGQEIYDKKLKAIEENHIIAKEYQCAEDWIFNNILTKEKII